MTGRVEEAVLDRARDAAGRSAWDEAYELFVQADGSGGLDPEGLMLFATAAYITGRPQESIGLWERVHAARLQEGDREGAAGAAARIAGFLLEAGLFGPSRGWVRRAEALIEDFPDSPVHGELASVSIWPPFIHGDLDGALEASRRAVEIGTRLGLSGIRAQGINGQARVLIALGQMEEGMALLDEAAVAAVSGELDPLSASLLYCSTVCAYQGLAEYDRAEEWTKAMDLWTREHPFGSFRGFCRAHRAEIMRLRGALRDAEEEAQRACDEVRPYARVDVGWPLTELGLIRLRMGNLAGAEAAYLESIEQGWDPQPGLALVHLAKGVLPTPTFAGPRFSPPRWRSPWPPGTWTGPDGPPGSWSGWHRSTVPRPCRPAWPGRRGWSTWPRGSTRRPGACWSKAPGSGSRPGLRTRARGSAWP
jgi:tetratricopeptide (TPR) repeat protein